MTEQEAEDIFLEINAILRRHELAWLANEITGEASEGQASPKMLSVREYAETLTADGTASRPKRRRTEFTHVRALTSKEKVGVSIKALRAIVVSSGQLLPEVIRTLHPATGATFSFVSDADPVPTVLSEDDATRFLSAARELEQQIGTLSEEVGDGS